MNLADAGPGLTSSEDSFASVEGDERLFSRLHSNKL